MKRNHSKILNELTRNPNGISTTEIARRTGLSAGAIRDWRNGRYKPTAKNRAKLNKFYKEYYEEQNKMKPQTTNENETVIYLDSRLVADMLEKEHKYLLRDIREYDEHLQSPTLDSTDFWVADTYKGRNGRTLPCYQISKMGCEFIQHKLGGRKNSIFTAKYVRAFHDMGERLQQPQAIVTNHPTNDMDYLKSKLIDLTNTASTLEELNAGMCQINSILIALHGGKIKQR